ncbi:hypothetical protein C7B77_02655 [Chamaesiphon polymorphus CCALA 037]|uniref:Uncharacterized protein n=1 Tax=Chamaesiphon polymorphus CCALA 037 TaxID=2107692 RepID=A0A2T1GM38_9CYAN|nr:hypothetical protein C7B77_02655 [Chamaesiphon polymorphus CCALA 037]
MLEIEWLAKVLRRRTFAVAMSANCDRVVGLTSPKENRQLLNRLLYRRSLVPIHDRKEDDLNSDRPPK